MKLHAPASSAAALIGFVTFETTSLGGSKKAEVYISGRTGKNAKYFWETEKPNLFHAQVQKILYAKCQLHRLLFKIKASKLISTLSAMLI
jgi:hypothetical protein